MRQDKNYFLCFHIFEFVILGIRYKFNLKFYKLTVCFTFPLTVNPRKTANFKKIFFKVGKKNLFHDEKIFFSKLQKNHNYAFQSKHERIFNKLGK